MFEEYHRTTSDVMKRVCFFDDGDDDGGWVDDIFGVSKVGREKCWICC